MVEGSRLRITDDPKPGYPAKSGKGDGTNVEEPPGSPLFTARITHEGKAAQ